MPRPQNSDLGDRRRGWERIEVRAGLRVPARTFVNAAATDATDATYLGASAMHCLRVALAAAMAAVRSLPFFILASFMAAL